MLRRPMYMRVQFARALLRLGAFIQSLAVVVMKPEDLVEFGRQTYSGPANVEAWSEDAIVDSGLGEDELALLKALPAAGGDLLLLGVGGGREVIPFARMGFRVTGVDYVAAMVDRARDTVARRGVAMEGLVQDIARLDVRPGAFDVVWLSRGMYSCVPTRARRVAMLKRIAIALKPKGLFFCQFHWDPKSPYVSGRGALLRQAIAVCTWGNLAYEAGDMLWGNIEFLHSFSSEGAIRSELDEGGFSVLRILTSDASIRGGAACARRPEPVVRKAL